VRKSGRSDGSPGSSDRTPAKHDLQNHLEGRFVGAAQHCASDILGCRARGLYIGELTAGTADGNEGRGSPSRAWHKATSVGLSAHHGRYPKNDLKTIVDCYEWLPGNFGILVPNTEIGLKSLGDYIRVDECRWAAHNERVELKLNYADGRTAPLDQLPADVLALLIIDPNTMAQFVEIKQSQANILLFVSMGCNAGGILMLPIDHRRAWVQYVRNILGRMTATQDALLAAIDGDGSRWGYLVVTARKWWERDQRAADRCFESYGFTLRKAWWKQDAMRFEQILDYMMVTKPERQDGHYLDLEGGTIV
jgi:hypothetical protein